ncbi:MFS transporter [Amycolatopsis sp. WAC 01416]|uniref:MFS transporter n=1 Tax=Amycolatopsis sp. WAC 01416 TaxID=2203196 RepID=UPI000F775C8F|nr:MFS transporter [Amycolatopsis sp. WAC 01416]RSN27299.1 MFS transporter [Amycolatopsis sp. WAC 01416]
MFEDRGTSGRSRWHALVVLCLASLMVVLDGTIVVVALPSIQTDLGFTQTNSTWIVNAYLVPFGGLLLFSGRLGDLIGRRRVFLIGLSVFTVASLLCGSAGDQATLIAFRCLQGVGGALTTSVVLGMIVTLFPGQPEQGKALGLFGFVQAGGASLGMILGGVLTQGLGWHWTMLVNVPIGLVVVLATFAAIERDRGAGLRAGIDAFGAVLATSGVMLLVYVIVDSGQPVRRWLLLALAVFLLTGFLVRQTKAPVPLMPLGLFRSRAVTGGNIVMLLMVAGMMGFQFLTALYLQRVLALDALTTGFAFLPTPVMNALVALWLGPRLIGRFGTRPILTTGLLVAATGLALLTTVPVDGAYFTDVLPPLLLAGIGMGIAVPAVIGTAMSAGSPENTGVASGLVNTTLQIGSAMGTAVLAAVAASRTASPAETVLGQREALTSGFRLAYSGSAAFVVLALFSALVVIPAREELSRA